MTPSADERLKMFQYSERIRTDHSLCVPWLPADHPLNAWGPKALRWQRDPVNNPHPGSMSEPEI